VTNIPLLNPQIELEGAQKMVAAVEDQLDRVEVRLTSTVLDREEYLKTIGAALALQQAYETLKSQYRTLVNK
jgi:hypothetical protein